jgi:hypothetical protein
MGETDTDRVEPRWFIDLDWYQQNNRSFLTMAQACLCASCSEKLKGTDATEAEILSIIKSCCAQTPEFITPALPLLESIFRLFLASGNQPLSLAELGEKLRDYRQGDTRASAVDILSRLLESDRYYGFGRVKG